MKPSDWRPDDASNRARPRTGSMSAVTAGNRNRSTVVCNATLNRSIVRAISCAAVAASCVATVCARWSASDRAATKAAKPRATKQAVVSAPVSHIPVRDNAIWRCMPRKIVGERMPVVLATPTILGTEVLAKS